MSNASPARIPSRPIVLINPAMPTMRYLFFALILCFGCGVSDNPHRQTAHDFTFDATPFVKAETRTEHSVDGVMTLGGATPAALGQAGHIYIVDREGRRVLAYDTLFRHLRTTGRRGAGPGEFSAPISIATLTDGRLVVLDNALRRILILNWPADTADTISIKTITLGGGGEALCVGPDDKLVILGLEDGHRIRVLDLAGNRLGAFAPVDKTMSIMAADALTSGVIACDIVNDRLVVAAKFVPIVEIYQLSTGHLLSTDTLSPYRPLIVSDKGKSFSISSGPDGYSEPVGLLVLDSVIIVQTEFRSRRDNAADTVITYAKGRSDRNWHLQTDLPPLTQLAGNIAFALVGDTAPTGRLYSLSH